MSMLIMMKEGGSLGIDTIGNLPIDEDLDICAVGIWVVLGSIAFRRTFTTSIF